jgi:ABC-type lipoprotein release transport system permease subunit
MVSENDDFFQGWRCGDIRNGDGAAVILTLAGSLIPAVRAVRADPAIAVRAE